MSLLRPTPGQIIDRYSALLVKRDKFIQAMKSVTHLNQEMIELTAAMPDQALIDEKANLYSIHQEMWRLVDVVGHSIDLDQVYHAAKSLHALNLERHGLIARIDRRLGRYEGDEKL